MKKVVLIVAIIAIAVAGRLIYLSQQHSVSPEQDEPAITVMDILHATDLEAGIKRAVRDDNAQDVSEWLDKAQHVATEAGLSDDDVDYLQSDHAREYVVFNAKRALFNDEFERRFIRLEGIDDLKEKYPQAQNLFEKADGLLKKREKIIYSIARSLAGGEAPSKADIDEAKSVWLERYGQADITLDAS